MSELKQMLGIVMKHFPTKMTESEPIIIMLAEIALRAGLSENEISELCILIGNEKDASFSQGIDVNQ